VRERGRRTDTGRMCALNQYPRDHKIELLSYRIPLIQEQYHIPTLLINLIGHVAVKPLLCLVGLGAEGDSLGGLLALRLRYVWTLG
jgi:hypothetical protein